MYFLIKYLVNKLVMNKRRFLIVVVFYFVYLVEKDG